MVNLRLYALKDEKTGICSMFSTAQNDEFAIQFYMDTFNQIFRGLKGKSKEKQRIDFLAAVHNSKLVRLADIDIVKPEVSQNLAFVADFAKIIVGDKENE